MRKFRPGKRYFDELEIAFGAVGKRRLAEALKDGRAATFLVSEHLLASFSNLRRAHSKYLENCVTDENGNVFRIRVVTENGSLLNPHKQNGVKRKFNTAECKEARAAIVGFILVDVTAMPVIRYALILNKWLPEGGRASFKDVETVFSLVDYQPSKILHS
jgi:hypothetical protein